MRTRNLSPKTIELYSRAGRQLATYAAEHAGPEDPAELCREHVESFLAALREAGRAAATISLTYRALQQLDAFLVEEGSWPVRRWCG